MMAQRLFNAFDRSGDGKVSLDELEGGLLLLCGGPAEDKVDFMFTMIDSDGDGSISQSELELFVSGFFILTEDTIDSVLDTVEALLPHPVGEDSDGKAAHAVKNRHQDFRQRLQSTVQAVLGQKRAGIVEQALLAADTDNDGQISLQEWRAYCDSDPQLLTWLTKLGGYWSALIRGEKVGDEDGSKSLHSFALQGFLEGKMRYLQLSRLIEALGTVGTRLDGPACVRLFESLGVRNTKLAMTMFHIFDPVDVPGEGYTVESRQVMIGLSTVCATGHDPLQRLDFAFEIFDADDSGELDEQELHAFFETFRRPVLAGVTKTMAGLYETCGYEDELREEVNSAAKAAFDDFVDGIVHSVFVGADTDNDRLVSKPEFMFWCGRHQGSLRWLSNLARYVLESLSETLVIDDFAKDGSDFDIA